MNQTISNEWIPEAYGFYAVSSMRRRYLCHDDYGTLTRFPDIAPSHPVVAEFAGSLLDAFRVHAPDDIDLVEGYEHQPNATGTGIVDVSRYAWMRELAPADPIIPLFIPW